MFQITLTAYGQTQISSRVIIDGIILLYDYIGDISQVTDITSYTVNLDDEACGNLNSTIGNILIKDNSNVEYQSRTLLLYKVDGNTKKILGGYSQQNPIIVKSGEKLSLVISCDFSAFTNGFLFSLIQSGNHAAHNSDGLLHLDDPNIESDDNYSVYSKTQTDVLLNSKQSLLNAGNGISLSDNIVKTTGIPFGICDSTSTSTNFTVTVPGIYKLEDGVCCMVKNGVINSAENFVLNVNNLGGKPCYTNLAASTRDSTIFNVNYTMLFVYDSTRVEGGCWICYRGYDSVGANTIGYLLRSNYYSLPASVKFYCYRLLFTSADGTHFVPANASSSTDAVTQRDVIQTPIDPFSKIVYYRDTAVVDQNVNPLQSVLWSQYYVPLGYSFNRTGSALTLTPFTPVYIKCTPRADGSAIIDQNTPYVQSLPSTADDKIYIFLGVAFSATNIELLNNHPVYFNDGTGIRIWTGSSSPSNCVTLNTTQTITSPKVFTDNIFFDSSHDTAIRSAPSGQNNNLNIMSSTGSMYLFALNELSLASNTLVAFDIADQATSNNTYFDITSKSDQYRSYTQFDFSNYITLNYGIDDSAAQVSLLENLIRLSFYDSNDNTTIDAFEFSYVYDSDIGSNVSKITSDNDIILLSSNDIYVKSLLYTSNITPLNNNCSIGSVSSSYTDIYGTTLHGTLDGTLSTSRKINNISFDGSTDIASFGICTTSASSQVKVATLDNYSLVDGTIVVIKFTYTNTATNPYLNINSTGAKRIYFGGYAAGTDTSTSWMAGEYVVFIYNSGYDRYYIIGKMLGGLSAGLDTLGRVIATSYTRAITATDCRGTTGTAAPTTIPAWNTTPNTLAVRASASEDLLSATGLGSVIAGTLRGFGVSGFYSSASAIMDDSVKNAESNPIGTVRLLGWERSPGTSAKAWGDPITDGVLHAVDLVLSPNGVQYDYYSSGAAVSGTWVTLSVVAGVQLNESNKVFVIIATRVM